MGSKRICSALLHGPKTVFRLNAEVSAHADA